MLLYFCLIVVYNLAIACVTLKSIHPVPRPSATSDGVDSAHINQQTKTDEQKILNLLEMDKSQLTAYISIAKEKGLSAEQTETLLDLIGKKARDNIRDNVAYYYRQREIDYAGLGARLPWLTPSEIEICDLILREKKQKEMIRILGKSESNITSQRANIRRKLGLAPSENLRDVLVRIASGD